MTRCKEFYDKWEKDPNWCVKCESAVRQIDKFLGFCDELEARGIPAESTKVRLTEGAIRPLSAIKDENHRDQAISHIVSTLNRKTPQGGDYVQKLTTKDVAKIIKETDPNYERIVSKPTPQNTESLMLGDFTEIGNKILDNSIHCIVTDPPVSEKQLGVYDDLGELAHRVLVPGGFLVVCHNPAFLPQNISSLSDSLQYYWTVALILKNKSAQSLKNVYSAWKPITVWNKPPNILAIDSFSDVVTGEAEFSSFLNTFCPENGTVLDPMAGTGTLLSVVKNLGRKFVGIEANPESFEKLKGRLIP